jgi:XTP/dITP diphosphohydrolase
VDILLATTNGHKIREIRALLKPFNKFDLYSLLDFQGYVQPEENGQTFEENALIKALHAAKTFNKWTLADDSGLVVPALGGAPGLYSARYAGMGSTDKENRQKLLKETAHLEGEGRFAYFECCIVLAAPEGAKKIVTGICEGTLLNSERGSYGFGYDSLFLKHDYNQTFAELDEERKNQVSHRAKALNKLKTTFESLNC